MRFWDASALVPLLFDESHSPSARALYDADSAIVVWWGSRVECASAIARVAREGRLAETTLRHARERLETLRTKWTEIKPIDRVRLHAERIVRIHPLRAADALQLAAALEWAGVPEHHEFVTLDARLRDAALREGFHVP